MKSLKFGLLLILTGFSCIQAEKKIYTVHNLVRDCALIVGILVVSGFSAKEAYENHTKYPEQLKYSQSPSIVSRAWAAGGSPADGADAMLKNVGFYAGGSFLTGVIGIALVQRGINNMLKHR